MEKDEFAQKIRTIAKRVDQLKDSLKTEEATKNSIIMPFFQSLGYDIFNPLEFIPENFKSLLNARQLMKI